MACFFISIFILRCWKSLLHFMASVFRRLRHLFLFLLSCLDIHSLDYSGIFLWTFLFRHFLSCILFSDPGSEVYLRLKLLRFISVYVFLFMSFCLCLFVCVFFCVFLDFWVSSFYAFFMSLSVCLFTFTLMPFSITFYFEIFVSLTTFWFLFPICFPWLIKIFQIFVFPFRTCMFVFFFLILPG